MTASEPKPDLLVLTRLHCPGPPDQNRRGQGRGIAVRGAGQVRVRTAWTVPASPHCPPPSPPCNPNVIMSFPFRRTHPFPPRHSPSLFPSHYGHFRDPSTLPVPPYLVSGGEGRGVWQSIISSSPVSCWERCAAEGRSMHPSLPASPARLGNDSSFPPPATTKDTPLPSPKVRCNRGRTPLVSLPHNPKTPLYGKRP